MIKWKCMIKYCIYLQTCTHFSAADKPILKGADTIVPPLPIIELISQTVLSCFEQSSIVWIGRIPIFKFPGCAISPLPDFLLLKVCAPKPALVFWSSFPYSLNNEIIEGIRVDRCQVSALLLTEGLSVPPVFLGSTPEVALVSILLPVLVTSFSASWWWYIKKVRQGLRCCSAQWSRCQLGCSGGQNFPCTSGNCYRSILSEIRVWKPQKPVFLMVA